LTISIDLFKLQNLSTAFTRQVFATMADFIWPERQRQTAFPIARPGYTLILGAAFCTAVLAVLDLTLPALLGLVVTFCICCFFRDPERVVPNVAGAVVSPADGKVIEAGPAVDARLDQGTCQKISIFMSVLNVHVNRIPHDGTVTRIEYCPGKFFRANLDKASRDNEHNAVFVETEKGQTICFVQIAGLIARRIISGLQVGDNVVRGRRFGMICFGSRLDVYLPEDATIDISVGDRVTAGISILGYLS
jgi:phosphatidylserine decarboxylase